MNILKDHHNEHQTDKIRRPSGPRSGAGRETGLFPSEMLSDMIGRFCQKMQAKTFGSLTKRIVRPWAFATLHPSSLQRGRGTCWLIAVLPSKQGEGVGAAIVQELEAVLRGRGHRVLIADTSGTEAYRKTREFYRKNGLHRGSPCQGLLGSR